MSDVGRLPAHIPRPKTASASSKQELMGTVWQAYAPDTPVVSELVTEFCLIPLVVLLIMGLSCGGPAARCGIAT